MNPSLSTDLLSSAGRIVSAAHEFQIVGTVSDGPSDAIGIGHIGHLESALLLPLALDRVAVGEGQDTELPVPHNNRVPPSVPLLLQIPGPPVPATNVGLLFEEYVLDAGILDVRELLVGRVSPLLRQPTSSPGAYIAVHAARNAVAAMRHLGAVSAVARAVIEINVLHVWEQGPAFAAAFLIFEGGFNSSDNGAVLGLRQLDPVIAPAGRGGMPIVASDQLVIVFLGVHNPGQHELMLIREADAARRLSSDAAQGGYQDAHQYGNNGNDDQELY